METAAITFIVLKALTRWLTHPAVLQAHAGLDEVGVREYLVQLEAILYDLERMFPGLTQMAVVTSMTTIILREDIITVLREVGVPESQIDMVLSLK